MKVWLNCALLLFFGALLLPALIDAQGEAPELGPAISSSTSTSSSSYPSSTSYIETTTVLAEGCDASTLGVHWDAVNLIQIAANVTNEGACCMACESFQYCAAWSFNQESMLCELFSIGQRGAIPDGTVATDWISGHRATPDEKTYDCNMDENCKMCRSSLGTCSQCGGNSYLLAGECVQDCNDFGYINFGNASMNGKCVAPFVCSFPDCECPANKFGEYCLKCEIGYEDQLCKECRSDRYNVNGECHAEIFCKGTSYEELPDVSCNCKTPQLKSNCFRCSHRGGFTTSEPTIMCTMCRRSKYFDLISSLCLRAAQCPEGTVPTGSGSYGRECLPPSLCSNGVHQETGRPCECEDTKYCNTCKYDANGYSCVQCKRGRFLLNGECVKSCPEDYAHANTRTKYGRICAEEAFICKRGKSTSTKESCNCKDKKCYTCSYSLNNQPSESNCIRCKPGYILNSVGDCIKNTNTQIIA